MQAIYAVTDLERLLDFYEREGFEGTVGATPSDVASDRVAPASVYVRVEDVEAAASRVEAAGGRPLSPLAHRSWGERAAWFADPDGNVVAVARPGAPAAG